MPTYSYRCEACNKRFEIFQKMTDRPEAECPACKGAAKRLIGKGAGVIFKGSGFYETDYKKKSDKPKDKPSSCPMKDECKGCDG